MAGVVVIHGKQSTVLPANPPLTAGRAAQYAAIRFGIEQATNTTLSKSVTGEELERSSIVPAGLYTLTLL